MTSLGKIHEYTGLSWPGWTTVLIHAAGFVALTALTLHDFVPLLTDYRHRNVAIQINIIAPNKNDTIDAHRPSTSVCIPYYSGAIPNLARWLAKKDDVEPGATMEREAIKNHSWDVWNRWNISDDQRSKMTEDEFRAKLIVDLIKKLVDERDFGALELQPINLNWNQAIVDAVWRFLACVTDVDTMYLVGERPMDTTCMEIAAALSDLDGVRNRFELLYDKVISATMIYFDVAYRLSAEPDTPLLRPSNLIRQRPLYLFEDYFCFEMASGVADETYTYSPGYPNDSWPSPWQRFRRSRPYYITPSRSVLFGSLGSTSNLYKTSANHLSTSPSHSEAKSEINEEVIRLTYQLESTIRERRPEKLKRCSRDPVPQECVVRRQMERSIEYCGCRPFTFRFLSSSSSSNNNRTIPYCTKRHYDACNRTLRADMDRIRAECNDRCEYVTFKWQKSETVVHNPERGGLCFYVEVTTFEEVYKEFSQIVRDPPEKFVSQIGGLVNLYLGVSGLSLCALLTFCVRSYDRYKRQLDRRKVAGDLIDEGSNRTESQMSGDGSMNFTHRRRSVSDAAASDQPGFGFGGWTRGGSFHHGGSGYGHHTVKGGQMARMQRKLDELVGEVKILAGEMKMIKEIVAELEVGRH